MSTPSPPPVSVAGPDARDAVSADARATAPSSDSHKPGSGALDVPFDEDLHGTPLPEYHDADDDEDDDEDQVHENRDDDDESGALPYPEPAADQRIAHPPDFRPFFTLIEDSTSGEHHHPTVHYMFADDDPDLVTKAALETLHESVSDPEHDEDRFVILDLANDGKQIISATSLSTEWQSIRTQIGPAPSWGREDGTAVDRALMLRVSGREANNDGVHGGKKSRGDLDGLLRAFDEHLISLEGVLGNDETELETEDNPAA